MGVLIIFLCYYIVIFININLHYYRCSNGNLPNQVIIHSYFKTYTIEKQNRTKSYFS